LRASAFGSFIITGFSDSNPDTVIILADELLGFGVDRNVEHAKSLAYMLKGDSYDKQSNFASALENYKYALSLEVKAGRENSSGALMNTIGVLYGVLGNEARALEYYQRALKVSKEMGEVEYMEMCVSNIGEIYFFLGNYTRALEYLERGLELESEMGDSIGCGMSILLIADVYRAQGEYDRALDNAHLAMRIYERFDYTEGLTNCLYSMGDTYKELKKDSLALQYFNKGLEVNTSRDSSEFKVESLFKIGSIYREQGNYSMALKFCTKSQELANEYGMLLKQKNACECLYLTHRAMSNGNEALVNLEKIRAIEEALNTQETNNRLQQMEIDRQALKDSITTARKERLVREAHQAEVRKKNQTRNVLIGSTLLILVLAGGVYNRLRYMRKSKATLQIAKDRSESLLLNILPREIAEELKINGKAKARDFDMATIIFSDFKGFTEAAAKLSAQELVSEINTCFKAFDRIMGRYNVEKIKTIGDAYMAAGGLPVPTEDSVCKTVLAAIEMQAFITKRKTELDMKGRPAFEMRVGIHTGPVVAGIVGVKKFQYDIWGDTVNTASRMESSGEVGKVNVSQATYELLKKDPRFHFESRGMIEAKGKGEVLMYFVTQK